MSAESLATAALKARDRDLVPASVALHVAAKLGYSRLSRKLISKSELGKHINKAEKEVRGIPQP